MSVSTDPSFHRQHEQQLVNHIERLLGDPRLRVDTAGGRRPAIALRRDVKRQNREVELKRLMTELDIPDRELQSRMPVGEEMAVELSRPWWLIFKKTVGRIRVICLSPSRELLEGQTPRPMNLADLKAALADRNLHEATSNAPTTMIVCSTSGFTLDAHELSERRSDRTLILAEPNEAGGWTITGPQETKALVDLIDPEVDADKRQRIRDEIEKRRADLIHGGLGADRLAAAAKLPLPMVEEELKSYAKESGLIAKRLEGVVVLFNDGSATSAAAARGGMDMPFMQRLKALFGGKGDNEKKVSLLSERRAALGMQRDRAFEEMGVLEQKEVELRQQFKETASTITRKRITSQLVQLRKDLERRQQLLGMLNQQINVVSTHLHNLELVQQGQVAQLPNSEELANDAAAAEEVLAELQASNELAGSISTPTATGLSEEEQALYDELEREAGGPAKAEPAAATMPPAAMRTPRQPERESAAPPPVPERKKEPREAEPG